MLASRAPLTAPTGHAPLTALSPSEPGRHVDENSTQAGTRGFSGCLSTLQFERTAPLKAALHPGCSGRTSVQGPVTSSECGVGPGADVARSICTHEQVRTLWAVDMRPDPATARPWVRWA